MTGSDDADLALLRVTGGGLVALVAPGGGPVSLAYADGTHAIELLQHAASAFEPGLVQVWVRDRTSGRAWPTLGAGSGARVAVVGAGLVAAGGADGLRWEVRFRLHDERPAWAFDVRVAADGPAPREVDVVHTHDVALATPGALRANEFYVSQYLDVTPLDGPTGVALAVRQNLPQDGRHPLAVVAADRTVTAWATDALSVHGLAGRRGGAPLLTTADLPSRRLQHEHTLATLQVAPARLEPGEELAVTFAGLLIPDHPAATSPDDAALVDEALALAADAPTATPVRAGSVADTAIDPPRDGPDVPALAGSAYDRGRELAARDLAEEELRARWPGPWRLVERDDGGTLLSFFAGDEHVVTRAKELAVLRPHGTILRTGDRAEPDPTGLTVTAWMAGSPLSYLTRGHATRGRVLTTVRGYLGLHRAYGLRLFVDDGAGWRLLDLPSAFSMTLDGARWLYAPEGSDDVVEVTTRVPADQRCIELRVRLGVPRRVLVALHLAGPDDPLPLAPGAVRAEATLDGVVVRLDGPAGPRTLTVGASAVVTVRDDAPLTDDGRPRPGAGVVTLVTGPVPELALDLAVRDGAPPHAGPAVPGCAGPTDDADPTDDAGSAGPTDEGAGWWRDVTPLRVGGPAEAEALDASLPWLVRDALVHHLSPRGLEQYTGGAWGTRDVTQGPLELLLALDRLPDARSLLRQVFAAQNRDGSWPQAFGFLPGDEGFRHEPPHGDIVHWPVLALGEYLLASTDAGLLDEPVAWWSPTGPGTRGAGPSPVLDHVLAALDHARAGLLPGTHLVAYGHGDWNDSLQPADPAMARTMTSTWTVTLHHQALTTLAAGLEAAGVQAPLVAALRAEATAVAADLRRYLLVDGELAGYAQLEGDPQGGGTATPPHVVRYLVHPRDEETGLRRGSLQTIHALVGGLLDPDQAAHHVRLVREHLMGVDGVRLFDAPPRYHGGATRHFQRAETATFVGREIGLMYVHAHLRWCEAMALLGEAEALWHGLRQVLATTVGAAPGLVPGARRRQANTYASSSDAAVADRAEFAARYADVLSGATGLEGGWRIYSSGPGVLVRVVAQCLLGVRRRGELVEIDPVLPRQLDGLTAVVPLAGGRLRVRYRVGPRGAGVASVRVGDQALRASRLVNAYRPAGVVVALRDLTAALSPDGPELEVELQ